MALCYWKKYTIVDLQKFEVHAFNRNVDRSHRTVAVSFCLAFDFVSLRVKSFDYELDLTSCSGLRLEITDCRGHSAYHDVLMSLLQARPKILLLFFFTSMQVCFIVFYKMCLYEFRHKPCPH